MPPDAYPAHPFDRVAGDYDASFSDTPLGLRKRGMVHAYLERIVRPGCSALELNCGTGLDALFLARLGAHVTATDASAEMLAIAAERLARVVPEAEVRFLQVRLEDLADLGVAGAGPFDLVLSDFDGINCIERLGELAVALRSLVTPGGDVVIVYMPPWSVLEQLGRWWRRETEIARLRRRGGPIDVPIGGDVVRTWFHPVASVIGALAPGFRPVTVRAISLLAPPTWLRPFHERHLGAFRRLEPLDDLLSRLPVLNRLGDHVLLHFRRDTR